MFCTLSNNTGSLTFTLHSGASGSPLALTKALVGGTVPIGDLSVHAQPSMTGSVNFSSAEGQTTKVIFYACAPLTSSEIATL